MEAGVKFLRRLRTRGILGREPWMYPKTFEGLRFEVGHVLDHKPGLGKCVDLLTQAAMLCDRTHARPQKPGHQTQTPESLWSFSTEEQTHNDSRELLFGGLACAAGRVFDHKA